RPRSWERGRGPGDRAGRLGGRQACEAGAVTGGEPLRLFDPGDEAVADGSKGDLGIDVEVTRDVDRGEEDVAHLARDRGVRLGLGGAFTDTRHRLLQLGELFVQVGKSS